MARGNSKVLIRGRRVWLAWYPLRGRRCQVRIDTREHFFEAAAGPAYLCLGTGTPAV